MYLPCVVVIAVCLSVCCLVCVCCVLQSATFKVNIRFSNVASELLIWVSHAVSYEQCAVRGRGGVVFVGSCVSVCVHVYD